MPWIIDPVALDMLEKKGEITADAFHRIFGPTATDQPGPLTNYPYSLAAKLSFEDSGGNPISGGKGVTGKDFGRYSTFGCDVQLINSGAGYRRIHNARGVMSGVIDVTSYGAIPDDSTNNWQALYDAIFAASGTGPESIVWFPRTDAGSVYRFACPGGVKGLPLQPNIVYMGAPGVVLKRTDDPVGVESDEEYSVFYETGNLANWKDTLTVMRDLILDGQDRFTGIYIEDTGGSEQVGYLALHGLTLRNCNAVHFNQESVGYTRYGIRLHSMLWADISDCRFINCNEMLRVRSCDGRIVGCSWEYPGQLFQTFGKIVYIDNVEANGNGGFFIIGNRIVGNMSMRDNYVIETSSTSRRITVSGNTIKPIPKASWTPEELRGITSNGKFCSIHRNNVTPDLTNAAGGAFKWAIRTYTGDCAIVSNKVASRDRPGQEITIGIETKPTGASVGRNVIAGNAVGPGVITPIHNWPRRPGDALEDAKADRVRYDKIRNGVAATKAWFLLGTNERTQGFATADELEDLDWLPMDGGLTGATHRLYLDGERGRLYACGTFTKAGWRPCSRLAWWDGSRWNDLATFFGVVYDVLIVGDRIYACGSFQTLTQKDGTAKNAKAVAYSDDHGKTWSEAGTGLTWSGGTATAYSMALWRNKVAIGGQFDGAGGGACSHFTQFNPRTASFSNTIGGPYKGTGYDPVVRRVMSVGNELYLFGQFKDIRNTSLVALPKHAAVTNYYWSMCRLSPGNAGVYDWFPIAPMWFDADCVLHDADGGMGAIFVAGLFRYGLAPGWITYLDPLYQAVHFPPGVMFTLVPYELRRDDVGNPYGVTGEYGVNLLAPLHGTVGVSGTIGRSVKIVHTVTDSHPHVQQMIVGGNGFLATGYSIVDDTNGGVLRTPRLADMGQPATTSLGGDAPDYYAALRYKDYLIVAGEFSGGSGWGAGWEDQSTYGKNMNLIDVRTVEPEIE